MTKEEILQKIAELKEEIITIECGDIRYIECKEEIEALTKKLEDL